MSKKEIIALLQSILFLLDNQRMLIAMFGRKAWLDQLAKLWAVLVAITAQQASEAPE